jgi:hypothetical protein
MSEQQPEAPGTVTGRHCDNLACTFCGEDGFDLIGLKMHLVQWCEVYASLTKVEHKPEACECCMGRCSHV